MGDRSKAGHRGNQRWGAIRQASGARLTTGEGAAQGGGGEGFSPAGRANSCGKPPGAAVGHV